MQKLFFSGYFWKILYFCKIMSKTNNLQNKPIMLTIIFIHITFYIAYYTHFIDIFLKLSISLLTFLDFEIWKSQNAIIAHF